ncbi:MAG: hypothetical protein OEL89_03475 [Candidatus Peregrinibacteria bacterium]|nr:hypothetical protein [Candidatus Peregrinibacteria bacterium]
MFDFRHTKNFAITKLQDQGFEDIVIVKKYSITYMTGLPTPPFENRFDFTAVENGTHLKGTLICHRQFQDIKESQCEVEKKLF